MLRAPALKSLFRMGLVTSATAVLYELSNLLFVYHYFPYEYGMLTAVLIALITGVVLTKRYSPSGRTLSTEPEPTTTENPLERLTPRELQILELIHHGKTNKEIAAINFVELTTVKTHVNNLYAKLEVNNRKAAAKTYGLYAFPIKSSFSPPPENAQ